MPEHFIPRATLHEDLLRLLREDNEMVRHLNPVPDAKDRCHACYSYLRTNGKDRPARLLAMKQEDLRRREL
mgnify:CR=1 FL=1